MAKKTVVLIAAVVLLAPAVAFGDDGFLGVGAKFTWDNYKTPVLAYSNGAGAYDIDDYGGPNLGGEFHWGLTRRFVLTTALDFGYFSHVIYPYPNSDERSAGSVKAHYMSFGLGIGAKLYFWEPKAGEAVLYGVLGVGKYFTVCGNDDEFLQYEEDNNLYDYYSDLIAREADMIAGLASPFVMQVGVGAEFFATDSFSVGADLLGIRLAFSKGDVGQAAEAPPRGVADPWSGEQKLLSIYVYSALTMTFNLTAGDSGSSGSNMEADGEGEGEAAVWDQGSGDSWGGGSVDWGPDSSQPAPADDEWGPPPAPAPADDEWGPPPAPAPAPSEPAPSPDHSSEPPPPPPPGH